MLLCIAFCSQANANSSEAKKLEPLSSTTSHSKLVPSERFLLGKFTVSRQAGFVKISKKYASRSGMYMQSLAYDAFRAMYRDAKTKGINLKILSATRNFAHQKSIWEAKWTGKRQVGGVRNIHRVVKEPVARARKILEYSSMPGSSRHHWGTDIDLNAFNNHYFATGIGKKTYNWLVNNAPRYGFCQPYTAKSAQRPFGYNEEKWHWSFQPLSQYYTEQAELRLSDTKFRGFKGSETAARIGVLKHYVLGINADCR